MKHEWKKHEKALYLPKTTPEIVLVPELTYFTLKGEGNPNDTFFSEYIEALYSVSYAVKMSYKASEPPKGYYEYTVYPLEGIWDLIDPTQGLKDKSNLKFELMIRQPSFLTEAQAVSFIESTSKKKNNTLIEQIEYKTFEETLCAQMMHEGPYDDEPASFERMEQFCRDHGYSRISKIHKEIYISDARKTAPEKLKTVLRFELQKD
ncbi:MAG: GyrI-like domain-containing protein [Clostridiales bacterium]|nr:GyrI-like domain-containing protein [Clostridiales bacterium]